MADRDLTIRYNLDKSNAERNSQAWHAGEKQRIAETANAVKRAHDIALNAGNGQIQVQAKVVKAHEETNRALEQTIGRYASLGGAIGMVHQLGQAWVEVADQQRKAFTEFMNLQRESRVGAGVQGVGAEAYAAQTLRLSAASGLSVKEADDLTRQFEGSLPAGLQKGNIDRKTANDLLRHGAVMGARLGGSQDTRGELMGLIPQFGKINSVEEGLGRTEAIRAALTAGRGDDTPLTKALLNVAGVMAGEGGMVGTIEENAALVGVTSLSGGAGMADTRSLQLSRAIRGSTTKQAEALKKEFGIEVGSKMGLEDRLKLMVPKLREIGKKQDVQAYLRDTLDLPEENAQALKELLPNFEMLQERMKAARDTAKSGGAKVIAENEAFLKSPEGRTMMAQASGQAGVFLQGQGAKGFGAIVAQEQAKLDANPSIMNAIEGKLLGGLSYVIPGVGSLAEARAEASLQKQLTEAGVGDPFNGMKAYWNAQGTTPATRGQSMIDSLQRAGRDPLAAGEGELSKVVEKLDRLIAVGEEANKQREQAKAPAPLKQGAPPRVPARP